jgi:epoxyqueuosine reductase QueG
VEKLVGEFSKLPHVGAPICGLCIKACPFGQKGSTLIDRKQNE